MGAQMFSAGCIMDRQDEAQCQGLESSEDALTG
jgi:hypothetical protein